MEKHVLTIDNREKITVTEVKSVEAFDEEEINMDLTEGGITIKGKQLHMHMLDLESGNAVITGVVEGVSYTVKRSGASIMKRLFK